jgi:glycosyltransferase involved in cell wall biosynthesis
VPSQLDDLPTIALVTPTYNHAHVLEHAMRSVLEQDYPKLQYVVVDGGSTDDTPAVIDRYRDRLHAVIQEPDRGPHDALNKGFALTDGTVMGWLNSDDTLLPGSLLLVGTLFRDFPDVRWLTGAYTAIDPLGRPAVVQHPPRWTRRHLLSPYAKRWISQTSTFWRRDLWEEAGGKIEDVWTEGSTERSFPHAFDFELWARFSRYAPLQTVNAPIGCHRHIPGQEGGVNRDAYLDYANMIRRRERPRSLKERAEAIAADISAPLGRYRLLTAESTVAGAMGAPPVIVFDLPTYTYRRRQRLETSRKMLRRLVRR